MITENHDSEIAIEISHLTVSYGPVPALLDVSVKIPKGKLVGIIAARINLILFLLESLDDFQYVFAHHSDVSFSSRPGAAHRIRIELSPHFNSCFVGNRLDHLTI